MYEAYVEGQRVAQAETADATLAMAQQMGYPREQVVLRQVTGSSRLIST